MRSHVAVTGEHPACGLPLPRLKRRTQLLRKIALSTLMILLDVVHLPAVATSPSIALRVDNANNLVSFGLALGITATLVLLEKLSL
ncbi:MAG TPA: hypothetical protein V6D29_15690 [Leptolyngbyaceae cyanobacterium]